MQIADAPPPAPLMEEAGEIARGLFVGVGIFLIAGGGAR